MLKVVIADDEKLICKLVQALADWELLGMEVAATAENGLAALELVKSLHPDILITDIRMPGCNGLELIQQAKRLQPDLEIVIISGYAHFEYAKTAIMHGVGNYLLKPIKKEELMETLQRMKQRCEEKKGQEDSLRQHKNSLYDLDRLRGSLVQDLLAGHIPPLTAETLRETYYFQPDGDVYQVFLVKMDCDRETFGGSALEILRENIKEIVVNGLNKSCREVIFYFQSYYGYGIINYDMAKKLVVRNELRECLNQLEAKKNLFGSIDFSLSIGKAVSDPAELMVSLKGAQEIIAERLVEGCGRLLERAPEGSGGEKQNLLDKYMKVVEQALEIGNQEEVLRSCDKLAREAQQAKNICGRELLELVLSAGRSFIARCAVNDIEEIYADFTLQCNQCGNAEGLFELLHGLIGDLMQQAEAFRQNEAMRPIRLAKQYVMQHFKDPITLEEVCETTGFSVSYFSTLFKKETGEGFAKYLARTRIEEAKTLLRETNLPVAEICEQVGYSDRKHFTHTFHKIAGLNPAEYRKLYG